MAPKRQTCRQMEQIQIVDKVLKKKMTFESRDAARDYFLKLQDKCIQLNYTDQNDAQYSSQKEEILAMIDQV